MVSPKSLAGLADLLQQPHLKDNARLDPLSLVVRKKRTYVVQNAVSSSAVHLCLVIFFLWFFPWSQNFWSSQFQRHIFRWSRRRLDHCADGLILRFICLAGTVHFIGHWIRCLCEVFSNQIFNRFFGNIARFSRIQSSFPTPLSDRTAGWLPCAVFVE